MLFMLLYFSKDDLWVTVWLILLIFVSPTVILLSLRDTLVAFRSKFSRSPQALLLHLCAIFAALIGLGLWRMGISSGNPMANRQIWLILILPATVYVTPLLMAIRGSNYQILVLFYGPWLARTRGISKFYRRASASPEPNPNPETHKEP